MLKRLERYLGSGTINPSGLPSRNVTYQKEAIKHWKGQLWELEYIKKNLSPLFYQQPPFCFGSGTLRFYLVLTFCIPPVLIFVFIWYSPAPSQPLNQTWFERGMFYAALTQSSEPSMFISAIAKALAMFVHSFVSDFQIRGVWVLFIIIWGIGLQTTQAFGKLSAWCPVSVLT